jgi:hypothetical protein
MIKMAKQMPKAEKAKNFTVRLDESISDAIRERAKELDMSLSYYIAVISKLDITHGFPEHYGDPFEIKPEDTMSQEEIQEALEKLKAAGLSVTVGGDTAPITPAPAVSSDQAIIEAAKAQARRPPPERPKMMSVQELVAAHGANIPGIAGQMAGGVGNVSEKMRQAQQMAIKEERAEKLLKKNVLEAMGEEVVEDDGQGEED